MIESTPKSLPDILSAFVEKEGWLDAPVTPNVEHEEQWSCGINLLIGNQGFKTWFEVDEELQELQIFIYSPNLIPKKRVSAAIDIINYINVRLRLGRLALVREKDPEQPASIQFRGGINTYGGVLEIKQIETMLEAGIFAFDHHRIILAEIVEDGADSTRVWNDFIHMPRRPS